MTTKTAQDIVELFADTSISGAKWLSVKQTSWLQNVAREELRKDGITVNNRESFGYLYCGGKQYGSWSMHISSINQCGCLSWLNYKDENKKEAACKAEDAQLTHESVTLFLDKIKARFATDLCECGHDFPAPEFTYQLSSEQGILHTGDNWL